MLKITDVIAHDLATFLMDHIQVYGSHIPGRPKDCISRTVSFLRLERGMFCEHFSCRIDTEDMNQICTGARENHVLLRGIDHSLMDLLWCLERKVVQRCE
jgi:hypothetical protein